MHGLIIGKFLPFHVGHQALIEFGLEVCSKVTVIVDNVAEQYIPVTTRIEWIQETFKDRNIKVTGMPTVMPQRPTEHPDFWNLWKTEIKKICTPDCLIASADYANTLANVLNVQLVSYDIDREVQTISGTNIRTAIAKNWHYLSLPAKKYHTQNIVLMGPESTGKSTAGREIAKKLGGKYISEYAEEHLKNTQIAAIDKPFLDLVLHVQAAKIRAEEKNPAWLNIIDTDYLSTKIWAEMLLGYKIHVPDKCINNYTTVVFYPNTPMVIDEHRTQTSKIHDRRVEFFEKCINELDMSGRKYRVVDAEDWEKRKNQLEQILLVDYNRL